jgi:HEAT repeat protein
MQHESSAPAGSLPRRLTSWRIALVAILLALLGALVWQVVPSRDPVYEGRTLTSWFEEFHKRDGNAAKAREAILHMGTNAIPKLVAILRAEDSQFKLLLVTLARKQSLIRFQFTSAQSRRIDAFLGLDALGPVATPVVPELIGLLNATNYLIRSLTAQALGSVGAVHGVIVPALTNALNDPDLGVRVSIEESLGRIAKEPEIAIPALVAKLTSSDSMERQRAMVAISRFGREAEPARPALLERLEDPDPELRQTATNVLKLIVPKPAWR